MLHFCLTHPVKENTSLGTLKHARWKLKPFIRAHEYINISKIDPSVDIIVCIKRMGLSEGSYRKILQYQKYFNSLAYIYV